MRGPLQIVLAAPLWQTAFTIRSRINLGGDGGHK